MLRSTRRRVVVNDPGFKKVMNYITLLFYKIQEQNGSGY